MGIVSLRPSCALPAKPPGKPRHLIARREIREEHCTERVNDCGKREQHRIVVESKAVAAAVDDPAPKRANQGPQDERRKGAKDHSAGWMHRAPLRKWQAWARIIEDFGNAEASGASCRENAYA